MKSLIPCLLLLAACGGDDGTVTKHDAAVDSPVSHVDAGIDARVFMDAPPGTTPLTVKNSIAWCTITVAGGAESSADSIITNVTPGVITLTAKAKDNGAGGSLFKIVANMWHHTDGDSGTGETGTVTGSGDAAVSTVQVTVGSTAKCVWVCCPFKNDTGCPTTEQCL